MRKQYKDRSPVKKHSHPVTGSVAQNFHEGGRSEILADYLFSSWGTVTPARRQDDYGVDLYCTLTERLGQRAMVRDYFVVQVKSNDKPWVFNSKEAVKWLIQYPVPLFLAWVDKKDTVLRVYHVMPRFFVAVMAKLPNRLELVPEDTNLGKLEEWTGGEKFSLSAPILRIKLADFLCEDKMKKLRKSFSEWVCWDRKNCDLVRNGLLRLRVPDKYEVNEIPGNSVQEVGNSSPNPLEIQHGILTAVEAIECIAGQLGRTGDRKAALLAGLLVDYFQTKYPDVFANELRWRDRLPADLGFIVCGGLNAVLNRRTANSNYYYAGIEAVQKSLECIPMVKSFLSNQT